MGIQNPVTSPYADIALEHLGEGRVVLPMEVVTAIRAMREGQSTGHILLNFNQGTIQSMEVKEHTRL